MLVEFEVRTTCLLITLYVLHWCRVENWSSWVVLEAFICLINYPILIIPVILLRKVLKSVEVLLHFLLFVAVRIHRFEFTHAPLIVVTIAIVIPDAHSLIRPILI